MAFAVGNPIMQSCFVTEIRGSARPTSGKKPYLPRSIDVVKKW